MELLVFRRRPLADFRRPSYIPNSAQLSKRGPRGPRRYFIPAELDALDDKLRTHNLRIEVLTKPLKAAGEEFVVGNLVKARRVGFSMTSLEGGFARIQAKGFPDGTFLVDLAQPLANMAFYCLEPQAANGFAVT